MSKKDISKSPKANRKDTAHVLVRAGLSAIPIVGSPSAELFSAIITPPLTKRRDEWIQSIAEGLLQLEKKIKGFRIEDLSDNEVFVTTVMHASQIALRVHQKEKQAALRNAVMNAALPEAPDEDLQSIFLNYVNDLTSWHIKVLEFFYNANETINGMSKSKRKKAEIVEVKDGYFKSYICDKPYFDLLRYIFDELYSPSLLSFRALVISDLIAKQLIENDNMNIEQRKYNRIDGNITYLGCKFIEFIADSYETSPTQASMIKRQSERRSEMFRWGP